MQTLYEISIAKAVKPEYLAHESQQTLTEIHICILYLKMHQREVHYAPTTNVYLSLCSVHELLC